ncbi:hypothetical protein LCGC14_1577820 [marine sediment metagenome]|uniref:Uncharacterized protein n=1 Tax=marine sediment metagenome TaxID=412755 RepID=A0A0F9IHR1_9ZZZZ
MPGGHGGSVNRFGIPWVWPSLDKPPARRAAILRSCPHAMLYRAALLLEIHGGERTHDGDIEPVGYWALSI